MLDSIEFVITEALVSLRRNKLMTFAAVTTTAMALFLVGGLTFSYSGLANYAKSIESRFELNVFVKDGAGPDAAKSLGDKLRKLEGVKSVVYKSKKDVWEEFQKENPNISQGLEIENPLPDTYTVWFTSLDKAPKVVEQVRKMPEVAPKDGVQYMSEEQELIEQLMNAIRWTGLLLGPMMLLTGGVLIYNTIRLTMEARRKEIRIMQLVGATKVTVWTPLLIEGCLQGILGSVVATGVLWLAYSVLKKLLTASMPLMPTAPFPAWLAMFGLGFIGLAYGLTCSLLAIREKQTPQETPR